MKIGLDLDNTIFDGEPLYKLAFEQTGKDFYLPNNFDIYKAYPKDVADNLAKIFKSDEMFKTKLFDDKIPYYINSIAKSTYIITARESSINYINTEYGKCTSYVAYNSYKQLKNSGINIPFIQIYNMKMSKARIAKYLGIDLIIDDAPYVIDDCIKYNVPCILISTPKTPYNHHLTNKVPTYSSVIDALIDQKLVKSK